MPRMDKLSTYRTMWTADDTKGCVCYVRTNIVEWDADTITLRTGGWKSVTTKRKMNQAANQSGLGFGVHQRKGEWFVSWWDAKNQCWGDEHPFDGDSITLTRWRRYDDLRFMRAS